MRRWARSGGGAGFGTAAAFRVRWRRVGSLAVCSDGGFAAGGTVVSLVVWSVWFMFGFGSGSVLHPQLQPWP
jgi:hypothetical protein